MTDITIHAASDTDLVALNQLMFDLHHEHHLQSPEHFKTAEEIEQEKSIARYLDDPECLVFIARQQNEVVGFITGHFCELISTVSKPVMMGSIDELYITPQSRQQHVATRLVEAIERRFREYGVKQAFVEVWSFNQNALQFYQQQGFASHIQWLRKSL